ncbi:hypothetical protein [Mammaliicoccus sciuri]|uniref:hypothetical protein n=1 Tax=Mammaliicoccus sciuri TaxID=1296 RepID=UPI0034DD009F
MEIYIKNAKIFSMFNEIPFKYYEKFGEENLYRLINNIDNDNSLYPLDDPGTPNSVFVLRIRNHLYDFLKRIMKESNEWIRVFSKIENIDVYTKWILKNLDIKVSYQKYISKSYYDKSKYPYNNLKYSLKNGFIYDIINYYLKSQSIRKKDLEFSNLYIGHHFYGYKKYHLAIYRYKLGINSRKEHISIMSYIGIINSYIKLERYSIASRYLEEFELNLKENNMNDKYYTWLINLKSYIYSLEDDYRGYKLIEGLKKVNIDSSYEKTDLILMKNKLTLDKKYKKINTDTYLEKIKQIIRIREYDDDLKISYLIEFYNCFDFLDSDIEVYFYHEEYDYLLLITNDFQKEHLFQIMKDKVIKIFNEKTLVKYLMYIEKKKLLSNDKLLILVNIYLKNNALTNLLIKYIYIYLKDENIECIFNNIENKLLKQDIAFYYFLYIQEKGDFNLNIEELEEYELSIEQINYLKSGCNK